MRPICCTVKVFNTLLLITFQKQRAEKRGLSKGLLIFACKLKAMAQQSQTRKTNRPRQSASDLMDLNHLQPQALELEEAVLGALMIEQDAFPKVSEIIQTESFYDHRHQVIFQAVMSLVMNQRPIDILTVTEQLRSDGMLDEAGGVLYITRLAGKVTSSAHIEYHASIIAQKAMARELITFASEVQSRAFDETSDVSELIQSAEGELFQIAHKNVKKDYTQINPVIEEAMARISQAASRPSGLSGLASGFEELDKITSGWQKSDLVILAARPAMGKTAFALSMALNIAIHNRRPMAMFSLEMSNVQLVNRLITNLCEITSEKIRSGRLAPFEWQQLDEKVKLLQDAPLYLDDTPSLSITELRTKALRLKSEHDIELIIIDYLQLMNASGWRFNNRQEEISMISRQLKGLAKELDIPIIALSQLNRNVEGREGYEGKRPQLSDLRESGSIEQDADIVCMIHRPEVYKIYEDDHHNDLHGIAEIIIAKHRNGGVGDVRLAFQSNFARFSDKGSEPLPAPSAKNGVIRSSRMNRNTSSQEKDKLSEQDPIGSSIDEIPY